MKSTITRQATWTLKSGKTATATVKLVTATLEMVAGNCEEVPCIPRIDTDISVDGLGSMGCTIRPMTAAERAKMPAYSHVCHKLALTAEQVAAVAALRSEIEALPIWRSHLASAAKVAAESASYDAHRAKMAKAMSY